MPTFGATFRRVGGRTFEVQGRHVELGAYADDLPDVTHVAVEFGLMPGSYTATVFNDRGEVIGPQGECKCFSTDCSVSSIGCALTCFIFPLNLTCPRCFYCFLFG